MKKIKTNFIMLMLSSILCCMVCTNVTGQASVKIGSQEWSSKNLDVSTFRNGDAIPEVKTDEAWKKAGKEGKPAWCYYNNDPANGDKYGKLYNWYAVTDPRGLAPVGWHVPSEKEWDKLTDYLGGEEGEEAATKLKSKKGWAEDGNGTNESGFSGLPGGIRYNYGPFNYIGSLGYWWSSTQSKANSFWAMCFHFLDIGYDAVSIAAYDKKSGFSVRCVRD